MEINFDMPLSCFQIMKKIILPTAVIAAAPVIASSKDSVAAKECSEPSKLIKPSELPIYGQPQVASKPPEPEPKRSELEEAISVVRKELWVYVDDLHRYKEKVVEYVETGKAHTEFIIDFLKEEQNYLPRAGAIGLGGLTGLVLGLRGGFFRRLFYGSIGAGGMASLCYPREAAQYSTEAYQAAKKYAVIGYNFAVGVKPESKGVESNPPEKKAAPVQEQKVASPVKKPVGANDQSNPRDK
ncbi:hypothetical protein J437_LFUL005405, partial [Ladona fulva]